MYTFTLFPNFSLFSIPHFLFLWLLINILPLLIYPVSILALFFSIFTEDVVDISNFLPHWNLQLYFLIVLIITAFFFSS
jgi:hypothetical protein